MAPFSTRREAKDDGEEITETCVDRHLMREKENICKLKTT